jgi:TIGR00299 family protein
MSVKKEILYLECCSGISGDMVVGALLDLGADEQVLRQALKSLPLDGFHVEIKWVKKSGLDVCDFHVCLDEAYENHDHEMEYLYPSNYADTHLEEATHVHTHAPAPAHHDLHSDDHHHHTHRTLRDVVEILNGADLTERAHDIAVRIFTILGEAEAKAHGTTLEYVHFHEVGAVDSIVDITAVAVCMDNLGIQEVVIPVLYEGIGNIRCQHGVLPIPVPAVVNIAQAHQLKLHITSAHGEYVTPTGAAIAATLRTSDQLPREFVMKKIGLGAGKREQELSGILRAILIEPVEESHIEEDSIYKLETNIDDCSAEVLGYTMERLFAVGAKDVNYTPIFMKKNRPAYLLTVLCGEEDVSVMENIIFYETTSIGIRRVRMDRHILRRVNRTVETTLGTVSVKECDVPSDSGNSIKRQYYPEYESVVRICKTTGISYPYVYAQIVSELSVKENLNPS